MTELGLNTSELIAFAVIHGYTVSCGGYQGGMEMLGKWCGTSRQHAYRYLKPLIDKGFVKQVKASGGRNAAVYISTVKPSQYGTVEEDQLGRLTVPKRDGKPSQYGTHIDNNRYIDTPYSPPKRGRHKKSPNRALNYLHGKPLTEEEMKAMGISTGQEFYDEDYNDLISEMRLE
jgi:hypothetical protein